MVMGLVAIELGRVLVILVCCVAGEDAPGEKPAPKTPVSIMELGAKTVLGDTEEQQITVSAMVGEEARRFPVKVVRHECAVLVKDGDSSSKPSERRMFRYEVVSTNEVPFSWSCWFTNVPVRFRIHAGDGAETYVSCSRFWEIHLFKITKGNDAEDTLAACLAGDKEATGDVVNLAGLVDAKVFGHGVDALAAPFHVEQVAEKDGNLHMSIVGDEKPVRLHLKRAQGKWKVVTADNLDGSEKR
jgi:hypothetical protein